MAKLPSRSSMRRRGLTLMELLVVLVILVALAGIVIPLLPSMLGRAETASGATSQTEIAKWIQTYEQLYLSYPKDWDALVDSGGTFLQSGYVRGEIDVALDTGLTPAEAKALTDAGITRLQLMTATPVNKTFNPYRDSAASVDPDYAANGLTPAENTKLVVLTPTGQRKLGLAIDGTASAGKFVVFGFGRRASLVGKTVQNVPVVFRDDGSKVPDKVYCRYGVVFQVSTSAASAIPMSRARFVGVCNFKDGGIFTSDDDLQEFYDLNRGGS